ncbi:hypothetical protein LXL04_016259 [Taraxacum kok-saghyz]
MDLDSIQLFSFSNLNVDIDEELESSVSEEEHPRSEGPTKSTTLFIAGGPKKCRYLNVAEDDSFMPFGSLCVFGSEFNLSYGKDIPPSHFGKLEFGTLLLIDENRANRDLEYVIQAFKAVIEELQSGLNGATKKIQMDDLVKEINTDPVTGIINDLMKEMNPYPVTGIVLPNPYPITGIVLPLPNPYPIPRIVFTEPLSYTEDSVYRTPILYRG